MKRPISAAGNGSSLQLGYPERRGLQHGADGMREGQFGAGEDHHADSHEIGFDWLGEPLRSVFRNSPDPEYLPPEEGLQMYLDYVAYMPDPVMLQETVAAKLFFETCRASDKARLH